MDRSRKGTIIRRLDVSAGRFTSVGKGKRSVTRRYRSARYCTRAARNFAFDDGSIHFLQLFRDAIRPTRPAARAMKGVVAGLTSNQPKISLALGQVPQRKF